MSPGQPGPICRDEIQPGSTWSEPARDELARFGAKPSCRESCGALYFGSDSPAGLVNVKTWKNSARLTGIPVLYCRYRGQPGWPACHVIAKLIFDVFNRHMGD